MVRCCLRGTADASNTAAASNVPPPVVVPPGRLAQQGHVEEVARDLESSVREQPPEAGQDCAVGASSSKHSWPDHLQLAHEHAKRPRPASAPLQQNIGW